MKPLTERDIFLEALELPAPESRAAYLEAVCGQDAALRRKVDELLEEHYSNDSLLAGPALEGERIPETGPSDPESPAQAIGRYKLLERIGEGGFGEVWMAEQREPVKRRVALKLLKLGMDSRQIVARFEAERQALALMDHPNIAKIFDAGTIGDGRSADFSPQERTEREARGTEFISLPAQEVLRDESRARIGCGRPYFVMELVRGVKITEYCDENQLPTPERLRLFILVCQAIQHAHQKGIIHRDIKPSNILVTLHDGVPVPKVIDFGIAKATQQELTDKTVFTQFQQFIGTPAYISPEQAEMSGLDVDTRTDIYSLGVLLYELLTGTTPFDAKELMSQGIDAMRRTIREQEPPRPSTRLTQELARLELGSARASPEAPTSRPESGGGERQDGAFGGAPKTARGARAVPIEDASAWTTRAGPGELRTLINTLRGELDWIVMKCLEKDRGRRYETANGLAADIQRHLANEPVLARPPSAAYKFQKAFRRNKLAFAAGTAVVAALVLGVIGTTIGLFRAEKQRQASRRLLYASDMNLAQQALKVNNLGRARRLLDRHRPQPGEEDLCGWEWRYLWQLARGNAPVTLTNRPTQGFSVSFSSDGKRLAVGWWDGRVELWDVPARRWVRALTDGQPLHPGRVAFSPVRNRNLLAATSGPSAVTLYDLDSGRESILCQGTDQGGWDVRDLAFSLDGSKVVIYAGSTPEAGDTVWVVDVASARIESRHPAGRSANGWTHFGAARISPDNRRLYHVRIDDWSGRIQCIDLETNQELWQTKSPVESLLSMDISPDGRVLASASGFVDTTIHLWDTATGEPRGSLAGHTASVIDLAFTQDGRRLISAADDQTIRFWDTSTWTETQVLRGHTDGAWAIAISEPAPLVASAGMDGSLLLWTKDETRALDGDRRLLESWVDDVQPLDHSRVLLLSPGRPPELLDLKRDGPPVLLRGVGASDDVLGCFGTNRLCVWNVIHGPLGTNLLSNGSFSNGLTGWVAEQHGNALASFTRTFDFTNNQPSVKVSVTNAGHNGWNIQLNYPNLKLASNLVYTISFAAKASPATNANVAVSQAHPPWLGLGYYRSLSLATNWQWFTNTFQLSAGDTNARLNFGSMGDKLSTFWFADVRLQAASNQANQILIGEVRGAEFVQHGAIPVNSGLRRPTVAYNPARRLLAWSEGTSSRSLYLASLPVPDRRIELTNDVPGLVPIRFSDDGKYLAAAREPDLLRTWNVETGQIVASIKQNLGGAFRSSGWPDLACFAANGRVLVVGMLRMIRNEIEFHDLARSDLAPRRMPGGFFEQRLAVSPQGELVAASSYDRKVQLFDAATGESIEPFHGHLRGAFGIAFSPDGRRLFSTDRREEAVKLWDVSTGQELLTLAGTDAHLPQARWSADGNVILAGPPWQAWSAPSWEEIAAAEAKDKAEFRKP